MSTVAVSLKPNQSQPTSAKAIKRLLCVKEAAAYLGFSPWKVRQLVHDHLLPLVHSKERGAGRIDVRDLDSYVELHKRSEPI